MKILYLVAFAFVALVIVSPASAKERSRMEIDVAVTDFEGRPKSCAGETVYAIPVRDKSTGVIFQKYRRLDFGYASIYSTPELIMRREGTIHLGGSASDATRLFRKKFKGTKRGKCDESGTAIIEKLKPGMYYVIIPVSWKLDDIPATYHDIAIKAVGRNVITYRLPTHYRGGTFMTLTEVRSNETVKFDLKNQVAEEGDPIF